MITHKIKFAETHYEACLEIDYSRFEISTKGERIKTDDRIHIKSGTLFAPLKASIREIRNELDYMFYQYSLKQKPIELNRVLPTDSGKTRSPMGFFKGTLPR